MLGERLFRVCDRDRDNAIDFQEFLSAIALLVHGTEEDRYRLLARNMSDVISRHRRNGAVQFISPAVETLLGTPVAQLLGPRHGGGNGWDDVRLARPIGPHGGEPQVAHAVLVAEGRVAGRALVRLVRPEVREAGDVGDEHGRIKDHGQLGQRRQQVGRVALVRAVEHQHT